MSTTALAITDLNREFWEGVRDRKFLLQYDPQADRYQFPPRPVSLYSTGTKLEWRPASGRGRLVAHTLCHKAAPGYEDKVPYLLGIVELAEGPRVFAPIVEAGTVAIGQAMDLRWTRNAAGDALYAFAPAEGGRG